MLDFSLKHYCGPFRLNSNVTMILIVAMMVCSREPRFFELEMRRHFR